MLDKSVLKSKTFWFGVLTALLPLVPAAQAFLVENPKAIGAIWSVAIVILRLVTKDKVKLLP